MSTQSEKKIKYIKKVKRPVVRPCPCAVGHISCNYVNISHILGCPYNCSYCFLHTFYGKDEIVVYDNEEDILNQLSAYMKSAKEPLRIGTGQYSDSLALDKKVPFAQKLIEFFAGQDKHLLELKTKSAEVDHLLNQNLNHNCKSIFAWSVNPEKIVKSDEEGSVPLAERINAAKRCSAAGYPVAFHFDPIIHYSGWEEDYKGVIDLIFSNIDPENIAWISLGALRSPPELKDIIKKRFFHSCITWEEMELGEDGKIRYFKPIRIEIFKRMHEIIRSYSRDVYVYLCMERIEVWNESGLNNMEKHPYAGFFKFFRKRCYNRKA
ncbi:MAG: DNA photolyase [Candidatus Margulisiibacteriota bacterium]|nr:DNA photolyase [Candidatus Margulisiibacteriota bacterium]